MIAVDKGTGEIYEGCKTYIARIVGVHRNTIMNWERENVKTKDTYSNFQVRFEDVIREKQRKGGGKSSVYAFTR